MSTNEMLQIERLRQQQKSMGVAYLLWIFLGSTGAHRYYCRRILSAVCMSCLFFMTIVGYFGFIVSVFDSSATQYQVNFYCDMWVFCGIILTIWAIVDAFLVHNYIKKHNADMLNKFEIEADRESSTSIR